MTNRQPTDNGSDWKVKLTDNPFAWMSRLNWDDLADNCNAEEYAILDDIYRILTDGYEPHNIYHNTVLRMSHDEMKAYYSMKFPRVVGQAMEQIGRDLQSGKLPIIVEYPTWIIHK